MAEDIVEDVRLLEVVELVRLAGELAGGEAAGGRGRGEERGGDPAPCGGPSAGAASR